MRPEAKEPFYVEQWIDLNIKTITAAAEQRNQNKKRAWVGRISRLFLSRQKIALAFIGVDHTIDRQMDLKEA